MEHNVVFMGSPDFSVPILRALAGKFKIVGVVTQPDRPAGRGQVITLPPIKKVAVEMGLPYIQPRRLHDPEAMEQFKTWNPELIVVAAFGQILRPEVLNLPRLGCINVHASLLPRWRGAAPIQATLLNGDLTTGVTIMLMDPGIDTGPILSQSSIDISPSDTSGSLGERLARTGSDLLMETLPGYINDKITPRQQDEGSATYTRILKKEDGQLDFHQAAELLERKVRAFNPWPGAYTSWQNQPLKIHRAHISMESNEFPGKRISSGGWPAIGTEKGLLILDEVQPAGKRSMTGVLFLRGARNWGT